ncbi:sodium ion-translocating decarboxylase subunit beta [Luteococcus peritonei]|uniref:Sodium ion-translocating decarboxylase subunit beta n=1 Tax=Luteococcus peritonei TaxID=88874 RepID=A0ABW4RVF2_9ACTN
MTLASLAPQLVPMESTIDLLLRGLTHVTWQGVVMMIVGGILIGLAVVKEYEPLLLLPIGAGCLLTNLPLSPLVGDEGMFSVLRHAGVDNELFPLLIFVGIGAMTDFGPLLENPKMVLLGAAGQFGIFMTLILAVLLGFSREQSASIGIIGAIDGPTSIYVSRKLAPDLLAPITVAAYSYMSLVPIIMPPIMRALTTQKERSIQMPYSSRAISRRTRILFPVIVTVVVGILVPFATPLIGMLMFGNLMRESGVVERLVGTSSNELANIVTLFLGLAIGSTMVGSSFLKWSTLMILVLGLLAFCVDTAAGVLFGKLLNVLSGGKFNPLIGAAGISAFPMAARVVQKEASRENFENFILMHAMGANAAGQVASCVAGGVLLALMGTA